MATNAELQKSIAELSEVDSTGMTNADMVSLLAQLKEAAAAQGTYAVAPGKAITSLVGIVAEGRVVTAKMLAGGQEALEGLVAAGICVETEDAK